MRSSIAYFRAREVLITIENKESLEFYGAELPVSALSLCPRLTLTTCCCESDTSGGTVVERTR